MPVLSLRGWWLGATCPWSQLTNDGGWNRILVFLTPSLCFFPLLGISNGPTSGIVMTIMLQKVYSDLISRNQSRKMGTSGHPVRKAHHLSAPTQWHPDLPPVTLGYWCHTLVSSQYGATH